LTDAGDPVGPNQRFVLGTDLLGRDYLSRLLHGARVSLVIGVGASLLASILGVAVGVTASIAGTPSAAVRVPLTGKRVSVPLPVEGTLMRLTDAALAFPILLLALALTAVAGSNVLVTLGIVTAVLWTYPARIVYARVSVIKELPFIEAARAIGIHPARLVVRHVLPHIASVVIAYAALAISAAILFEATLSYLGVGIPPPSPSWGSMIADHFSYYASDPRLLYLPGGAVMLTVLSFNLIGDALRDALDPFAAR
jgi:peptide/nickel transport system permease protein